MDRLSAAAIVIASITLAPGAAAAEGLGHDGELLADLPMPDAAFQAQGVIHEGGLHFFLVATAEPEINVEGGTAGQTEALPIVFRYKTALESAGWNILGGGGGGNPYGSAGGAHLMAEHEDGRYLRLNAGHPGVQHLDHAPSVATFIDGCVWPGTPIDDACHARRWIDETEAVPQVEALTSGVPVPAVAEYRADDVIPGGGRHFHYLSAATHFGLFQDYLRALHEAGWTITDVGTHGDASIGGGGGVATDGTRHLRFSTGGSGLVTHFDACVWPAPPEDDRCPRSGTD